VFPHANVFLDNARVHRYIPIVFASLLYFAEGFSSVLDIFLRFSFSNSEILRAQIQIIARNQKCTESTRYENPRKDTQILRTVDQGTPRQYSTTVTGWVTSGLYMFCPFALLVSQDHNGRSSMEDRARIFWR
jgi:hypothetical protein